MAAGCATPRLCCEFSCQNKLVATLRCLTQIKAAAMATGRGSAAMLFRHAPTRLRPGSHDLAVSLALATLPQPLIAGLLRRMTRSLPQRYPKLAARLAELQGKRLLIVPDELPYAFLLDFPDGQFSVELVDPEPPPPTDAQMRGPLRLFYDLVRGGRDGDALFFSRELAVTGDMAAAVTLRNAMDGAGVDLFAEFLDLPGPLGPVVRGAGVVVDRWAGILLGPLAERTARLESDVAALRSELRRLKDTTPKPRPKPGAALAAALGPSHLGPSHLGAKS
jgi:predicted lipid carrier protein YhbT